MKAKLGRMAPADSAESCSVDQILPACGLFAIDGDLLDRRRLGERDFLRVGARDVVLISAATRPSQFCAASNPIFCRRR